ncbi:ABC transporter permease [uncultured Streptomyces sp.]|uniref:ABC transporter permease n=1 Tax=uncultured Streptomyces sp. TaxID=174707 RepID=UPI0026207B43|nr:ABC transporter permease subunit [uncultured Streptomyces sp.]
MTTTLTDAPAPAARTGKRGLLHGLTWLVVRQHRAALYCVLALTVLGAAAVLQLRHEMIELLDAAGWPGRQPVDQVNASRVYDWLTLLLGSLPVILAVFLGAPLIAGDQEQGTAQLVTTQSVPRRRWLIAKLGLALAVALVSGTVLSALFTWWWKPYRTVFGGAWLDGAIFDSTGPVLPALCLFLTAAGITVGVLTRRVLAAMTGTFVFSVVALGAWDYVRPMLAPHRTFTYPLDGPLPDRFAQAQEMDRWIASADGTLYGWGLCAKPTEAAAEACVKEHGIVNSVMEYLDYDQMPAMQWTGAGVLLAGTVLLTVFVVWRASRRPL